MRVVGRWKGKGRERKSASSHSDHFNHLLNTSCMEESADAGCVMQLSAGKQEEDNI